MLRVSDISRPTRSGLALFGYGLPMFLLLAMPVMLQIPAGLRALGFAALVAQYAPIIATENPGQERPYLKAG